jgi:hypothetical protein
MKSFTESTFEATDRGPNWGALLALAAVLVVAAASAGLLVAGG